MGEKNSSVKALEKSLLRFGLTTLGGEFFSFCFKQIYKLSVYSIDQSELPGPKILE